MPLTNFPNGISSFGVPILGNGGLPFGIARDAKTFVIDARTGSDGQDGLTRDTAVATVTQAKTLVTDEAGDVVYFVGTDSTTGSSSRDTAEITWDSSGTTLMGVCAPVRYSQRSRIAPTTAIAGPNLTVSGNNNIFANFSIFNGYAGASTALRVTGDRNYFYNVHIGGIGHATAGDAATAESLLLEGGENVFDTCVIGLDTIARSAACAEIRFVASAAAERNIFRNCIITGYADNAGALFVDIPLLGIDRFVMFENCKFLNLGTSTMTVAMTINASPGGKVILDPLCTILGATDWADSFTNVRQCGIPTDEANFSNSMGFMGTGD